MSNAITQYSVDDPSIPGHRLTRYVNAKEDKQSFNITVDHKFNDHWNLGLAYTHFIKILTVRRMVFNTQM